MSTLQERNQADKDALGMIYQIITTYKNAPTIYGNPSLLFWILQSMNSVQLKNSISVYLSMKEIQDEIFVQFGELCPEEHLAKGFENLEGRSFITHDSSKWSITTLGITLTKKLLKEAKKNPELLRFLPPQRKVDES